MACYHPLTAWYSKAVNATGKRSLVFSPSGSHDPDRPIQIPCGNCIGCRLERSRQWALRCVHEASLHENNCFITLTFNDESLFNRPNPDSLDVREFQLFMKRLRKRFGSGIRFFHCGEYGEHSGRPHYHACIFNFDFPDKVLYKIVNGNRLYISQSLSELWPYGFSVIGDVTFDSAAYVARYILKKINGDAALDHYVEYDKSTGEVLSCRVPEYCTMSRRPGIGHGWYEKYHSDLYPKDFITHDGVKMKPPKYYDRILEQTLPDEFEAIKDKRREKLLWLDNATDELTPRRLAVREQVKVLQTNRLLRDL